MTKSLDSTGLRSVFNDYDFFFIDLWGVIHNGVSLNEKAVDVLNKISEAKKDYVLLTNAPRPNKIVKIFLEKMGLNKNMREKVYTSGEAALNYLKKNFTNQSFFHIGPIRDIDLFVDFKNKKTNKIDQSDYDEHDKELNYYEKLLPNFVSKKMICTNPDLIVDRGESREYCAGSVALVFEKLGGEVIYFGKPYPEVYKQAIGENKKKILAIGDNLRTDIRGAHNMEYDSLIITSGIHKNEIKKEGF